MSTFNKNENGCWEWKGATAGEGYGVISFFKRSYYVHRIIYRLFHGEISRWNVVMHKCDNPSCMNPEHLTVGSQKDNVHDMISKGRQRYNTDFFRTNNPKSKFSEETIKQIKEERDMGIPLSEIQAKHGISKSYLSKVINSKARGVA